jgi:hypothetical protein
MPLLHVPALQKPPSQQGLPEVPQAVQWSKSQARPFVQ